MARTIVVAVLIVIAGLAFTGTARASAFTTCSATAKGAILTKHVSCNTAYTVLRKAAPRIADGSTRPNVTSSGHYWTCRVQFPSSHQMIIACAYDGVHAVGATVHF